MNEPVQIYQSILDNDIRGARTVLEQYLKNRGLKEVPALPVEHSLAVFKTLSEAGLGRLIARAVRAMASHPEADFWHRLFYDWGLRGSLGFLVTLELMEQLESEVLGSPRRHAPLRDLVIDPLVSKGDSLVSKRERDLLHELAGRPVRFQAAEAPLYQFALTCMRACLYAGGYWQRTAREYLERGSGQLDAMSPYLDQRPLLASMLVQHLLSGYTYLRDWLACDRLLERLQAIPAARDDGIFWQVRLAECRGELDQAHRLLLEAESQGQATSQYWELRGAAATKREDFREAEACFQRSTAIVGRKPHAYSGILGMSRYRLGNHEEAVRLWKTSGSKYWGNLADGLETKMASGGLAERVALDIPSIVQKPNHCGPCALSMIARFWGVEMSQEEIAARLSPWGTQLCELAGFAESRGLAAVFGSRDFDAVVRTVEAGFPVLLVFSHPGGGHYVIAKGYDPNLESLEIRDPDSTYTYLLDRTRYREEAAYHDYQTAVICPPDRAATVPALHHAESLYRDLAKTMVDIRSAQAICEDLASRHSAEALAEFNGFADLQFRKLLDDHQLEAARKLADEILRRNEDGLYACSRVAEVFLRACCVQDAYQAVCRVGSSTEGRGADRRDSLSDLLRDGRSPSHEYLEFIRARCAQQLGNLQVAAISLTRSINRYPVHGGKFLALADLMGRLGEEEEQLKFLDIAQQISGPNTRAATTELAILRRKGEYAAAKDLIEKTLAQFPDEPWLWLEKGQICEEMHLFDEAADCYRRLCEELPHWHRGYTQLLGLFHRAHDIRSGETLLGQLEEKMGEVADRWCVHAYWASLERDWSRVLEAADRCLSQASGNTWALYFKAEALEAMGRLKEAAAVWQGVIEEVDPSDYYWDVAVASLGRLGRKLEDLAAFEATFQHAIGVAPDSPSLWAAMCDCFRFRGRGQEAHQYFESLYQRVTDKAGLSMNVGHLLLDLRLMPEARSWFERVPSHNAAFPDAVRGSVRSLRDENRLEESLVLLRQTAEQSPSPEMYSLLIEVCLDAYQIDEAAQWLRRSLADYPDSLPDAAYRLVRVMDSAGANEELQSLVEFVEQRKGALVGRSRSDMLLFAAYIRRYLRQFPEALALCEEVLSIDPVSGPAWIVKAEVQYEEGDFEGAIVSARNSCATQYSVYPFRCLFEYLRNMGRVEEAFDVCIQGLELFPRDLSFQELLDQLVLEFQMLDRYLEACRGLFPVVEDKASFLGNQGTVFWRMGDDVQAQQLYEQALEYGNYSWLHAQLGVVLREQGDFLGAERELRTAIGLDPHYTYAAQRLAAVYADWFFSYEQLARDFGGDPAFPSQEVLLERIHQFYGKTAEVLPNSDGIFRDYCQFCARCGDLAPVKRLMPHYAENSSVYSAICCHLAEACGDLHDVGAAREWLQQAVASDEPEPQKAQAYHNLGWHINAFDYDPNEALCWYRRAVAAEPDGIRGYLAAAAILEEQGRSDEALQELLAGLDQVEDPTAMLQTLARTAVQAGRWEKVRQAVDQRLQRLPSKEAALGWLKVSRGLTDSHDHRGAQAAMEQAQIACVLPLDLEATRLSNALKQSEYATAEAAAQRLLQFDPDNLSGLYESAGLALRRSDVPVALGFLERFIKAGGELPYYLTNYAYAAADLDRLPELFAFCEACYTEGQARGHIHLLEIAARHLCDDAEKVDWLVNGLEEVDASKVSEAEVILADMLVNQRRYEKASPRLTRAIARDPYNTFARCLFVGTELALENIEAGIPHLRAILEDPDQDYWAMMALCKTPISVSPDLQAEADRFQAYFEPFAAAAEQVRDRRVARPRLLTLAHRWHLDSVAAKYAREVLDDRPFPEVIPELHEVAVESGDLDLADRILAAAQTLHVHPTTIAQLKSITHAMRGEVDGAIHCAYESRHGHGAEFAEMCQRLLETHADLGDLSDTLFDCMLRYHQGHGPCSTWALLLLFDQGRVAQFEQGLAQTAASIQDYRLAIEQRRSLAAAVAGARLYRAQQTGDLQEQTQIRREIEGMPFFGCDVGKELYQLLGLARNRG